MSQGVKLSNEYVEELGKSYAETPKAVFAAVAYSFAVRLFGEHADVAECIRQEWITLHENGIVPQKTEALPAVAQLERTVPCEN